MEFEDWKFELDPLHHLPSQLQAIIVHTASIHSCKPLHLLNLLRMRLLCHSAQTLALALSFAPQLQAIIAHIASIHSGIQALRASPVKPVGGLLTFWNVSSVVSQIS